MVSTAMDISRVEAVFTSPGLLWNHSQEVEAVGTAGVNLEKALLDRALAVEQSTVADEVVGGLVEVGEAVVAAVTTAITPALKLLVAVTTMDLAVIPDMRAVMRTVVRVVADILGQLRATEDQVRLGV